MIYVDSSVVLSAVAEEPIRPQESFWEQPLISSRLMLYECWNRLYARSLSQSLAPALISLTRKIHIAELSEPALRHALKALPSAPKTLDAMHLSTLLFLAERVPSLQLATYDKRMEQSALALNVAVVAPRTQPDV